MVPMDNRHAPFALVTGTSAGIGHAVAQALLARGWNVVGLSRRPAPIDHARYEHLSVDLADTGALNGLLGRFVFEGRRLAERPRLGLVNNAADPGELIQFDELDPARFAASIAVNVTAPVLLMRAFLRARPAGVPLRIVNVSTGAAVRAFPGLAAYCTGKAALRMAGQVVGAELDAPPSAPAASEDVAILSYEPGVVDTDIQTRARSTPRAQFPWVDVFIDFARKGLLKPPAAPAADIADFLGADGAPHFSERRFGG